MSYSIRLIVLFVTLVLAPCLHGFAQDETSQATEKEPQPVRVTASKTTLESSGKSTLTLTLLIEPGVAIYTNAPHEGKPDYTPIPTKIEFLDSNHKLIETAFQFPRGTLVKGALGGTYMYTGAIAIKASFPSDVAVEKLTMTYHGYRYRGEHLENGYN